MTRSYPILCVFAVVICVGSVLGVPVPVRADTLIYSDQSPGALPHGLVWQMVAESRHEAVIQVTTAAAFGRLLPAQAWSEVIIVARYAPGEPIYARALRDFAAAHHDRTVLMYLWHDNGTQPTADTVVAASMAIVLWNHGRSTITYSNVSSRVPEMIEPRTVAGYQFPDFEGIELRNPRVIARLPRDTARAHQERGRSMGWIIAVLGFLATNECQVDCLEGYNNKVNQCNDERDTDQEQCDSLYGPGGEEPGDPEQYQTCVAQVNEAHTACVKAAVQRYNRCLAVCALHLAEGDLGDPGAG